MRMAEQLLTAGSRYYSLLRPDPRGFRDDQGNSSDTVDGNLSILRYRMEHVRMKERLDTCYKLGNYGWNYKSGYDDVRKKHGMVLQSIELATIVVSTVGLVFLSGSLCIFIVALLFHHSQI
ncbi:hypothetical protein Sango_1107000 [Sesamum angolense]|uniref:Uncharacterized protein n=1 Tax=Sesamum angolense TaxID=2727404 RepID=A0AAE2BW81_9LAMI|nr:hypothetical protein Sango_1107000 [Sesamum angolense]